jgi:hypothetical protein
MFMSALPSPQSNDDEHPLLPLTPELIGKINGMKPAGITSDQMREFKRMLNGFTGGILVESVNGRVVALHKIKITTYKD